MKKTLLCSIVCCVMLMGCGADNNTIEETVSKESGEQIIFDEIEYEDSLENMEDDRMESMEERVEETIEEIESQVVLYPFEFNKFSEGVAWVKGTRSDTGEEINVLINEDGETLFVTDNTAVYLSDCQDGTLYLRKLDVEGNVTSQVIDKTGTLLFESKDINDAVVLCYGNDIFIVGKYVKGGFDTRDEVQVGVVDRNGQWIFDLSADKFIIDGRCAISNITSGKENTLRYMGDGIFMAQEEENAFDYVFYNSVDNLNFSLHGYWYFIGNYYNGKLVLCNGRDYGYQGVNSLDRYGNLQMIADIDITLSPDEVGAYSDGLWYYQGVFYNAEGTKVVDISQYSEQIDEADYVYPVFKDGYSVIVLKGVDGNTYYTVIDMQGNFMFEPRILEEAFYMEKGGVVSAYDKTSPGELKDQMFCVYENSKWVYYNVFGEKKIEVDFEVQDHNSIISTFNSNIALLKMKDFADGNSVYKYNYIDKNGKSVLNSISIPMSFLEN